jgi:hypothetical protein
MPVKRREKESRTEINIVDSDEEIDVDGEQEEMNAPVSVLLVQTNFIYLLRHIRLSK